MLTRKTQNLFVAGLLVVCVILFFIFKGIEPYFFSASDNLHIIDVHVKEGGFGALFDVGYISKAAKAYDTERYQQTFFLVDLVFPVVYSSLFLFLSYQSRKRKWYKWILLMYIAGALFDYGENSAFLYYLHHPSDLGATVTAYCTSFKSILFVSNALIGLFLFVRGFFK